jgi:hypothetical protein
MREIRTYGSVRGVRSNPHSYRDKLQRLRSSHSGSLTPGGPAGGKSLCGAARSRGQGRSPRAGRS